VSTMEVINTISYAITAAGVLLGVFGLRQARVSRMRDFESFYVKRYWDLFDGLSISARQAGDDAAPSPDERRIMHAYLHLCEDEVDLRQQGWITDDAWQMWTSGISSQVERASYARLLSELPHGEVPLLRAFIESGYADPQRRTKARARWAR